MCKLKQEKNKSDLSKLTKRQWTKWLSDAVAIGLTNCNTKSKLHKSYFTTYHCASVISVDSVGKTTSHFCKKRWCNTCNRIRTAILINSYAPELEKFKDAYFVTLTRQTCTGDELANRMEEMQIAFRKINDLARKAFKSCKGTDSEYKGLRKLECTLRPNDKYHPHFHVMVNTKEQAEFIQKHWLRINKDADIKAQDIRKADKNSYKELFKYFTKLLISTKNKREKYSPLALDYKRLDVMFQALVGRQVFRAFGSLKMIKEDFEDDDLKATINLGEGFANQLYKWCVDDYFNIETGEALLNKSIPSKIKNMLPQKVAEKEMIEQTNYLPPLKEFGSTADAFDDERPVVKTIFDIALQSFRSVEEIRSVLKPTIKHNQLKIELE